MKRKFVLIGAALFLSIAPSAVAEVEVGMSLFPASQGPLAATPAKDLDWMVGFHVAYAFLGVGYLSWDAVSLPNYLTENLTGSYDVPSFLNLLDAGLRLGGRPFFLFAEAGVNNLWIYDQGFQPLDESGVNLRAGLGVRFDWWGLSVSATEVYPTFASLSTTAGELFGGSTLVQSQALDALESDLLWSVGMNLYF